VRVVQPERQVDPPRSAGTFHRDRDVVALVAALARRRPGTPLIVVLEPNRAGQVHYGLQQSQHVARRAGGADMRHDVEVTPAHQARDVATRQQRRTGWAEVAGEAELVKQVRSLGLQGRLASEQFLVGRDHR
jgi:hypothetical protein